MLGQSSGDLAALTTQESAQAPGPDCDFLHPKFLQNIKRLVVFTERSIQILVFESYLPQMHKNSSIQSAQPSVRSSKLLQLLLAKAKLLRIHVPQASHISAFDPVNGTHLPKSMVGFAATLDYVSAGVSQLENVSGTLS